MSDRVLVITERYPPEPFIIGDLVNHLVALNKKVTVLTQVPSYPDDKIYPGFKNCYQVEHRSNLLRVVRVKTILGYKKNLFKKIANYFSFMIRSSIALFRIGRRYDGVFVFHTGPLTQALPLLATKGARGRRVLWTQDVWPDTVYEFGFPNSGIFKVLLESFVRTIYRHCDAIAITSPGFLNAVEKHCEPVSKIHYVPQWAPEELVASKSEVPPLVPDSKVFRFAGAIGTMQNLELVIRGFHKAHEVDNSLGLEIYGDGAERQKLMEMVANQGIGNVSFPGRLPMAEIMPILRTSCALVLPLVASGTVSKTIPAKFQAYLSAQRPIFAIMKGTVAEMVRNHDVGLVADPSDINSIEQGFLELARMGEKERATIAINQKTLLAKEFDKSAIFEKFVDLLHGGSRL